MKGNALIGDNGSFTTGATSSSKSNSATNGGGIYAKSALVYMGYDLDGTVSALGDSYGVCHNYASDTSAGQGGGGIYLTYDSALYMGSGKVSKNGSAKYGGGIYSAGTVYLHTDALVGDAMDDPATSTANSNTSMYGGGIYNAGTLYLGYNGSTKTDLNSGKGVSGNYASSSGGGLYLGANALNLRSGSIQCNSSGTAGGAIYYGAGSFNMGDSASSDPAITIPKGASPAVKVNDIFIKDGCSITLLNYFNNVADNSILITPEKYEQKKLLFAKGTYTKWNKGKFVVSDSDWTLSAPLVETGKYTGNLDLYNIYVSGTGHADAIETASNTAAQRIGTKAKPCNSIAEAVSKCWCATSVYYIKLSGELKDSAQTIADSENVAATKIYLQGYTGNSTDIINRNLSATPTDVTSGTALKITTAIPVVIKNITIKKGYVIGTGAENYSGGGIRIIGVGEDENANVTLDEGTVIEGNSATYGGGIFIKGKNAKLDIKGTNTYIGKPPAGNDDAIADSQTNCSNYASYGAGISIDGDATVTITTNGSWPKIRYNYAGSYGGAIYVNKGTASFAGANSNSYKVSGNGGGTGASAFSIQRYGKLSINNVKVIDNKVIGNSYPSIMVSGGVFEMAGSLDNIPYDASSDVNKKNYIYLVCAGYSGGIYVTGSINFLNTSTYHTSSSKLRIYVQGTDSNYANLPMLTTDNKTRLTTWLERIELLNSLPSGKTSQAFETDASLDSTLKSAYYRAH